MIYLYLIAIALIICNGVLNIGTQVVRNKKRRISRLEDAYADT